VLCVDLEDLFRVFGGMKAINVYDDSNEAFLQFVDAGSVERVLEWLSGKKNEMKRTLKLNGVPLRVERSPQVHTFPGDTKSVDVVLVNQIAVRNGDTEAIVRDELSAIFSEFGSCTIDLHGAQYEKASLVFRHAKSASMLRNRIGTLEMRSSQLSLRIIGL